MPTSARPEHRRARSSDRECPAAGGHVAHHRQGTSRQDQRHINAFSTSDGQHVRTAGASVCSTASRRTPVSTTDPALSRERRSAATRRGGQNRISAPSATHRRGAPLSGPADADAGLLRRGRATPTTAGRAAPSRINGRGKDPAWRTRMSRRGRYVATLMIDQITFIGRRASRRRQVMRTRAAPRNCRHPPQVGCGR